MSKFFKIYLQAQKEIFDEYILGTLKAWVPVLIFISTLSFFIMIIVFELVLFDWIWPIDKTDRRTLYVLLFSLLDIIVFLFGLVYSGSVASKFLQLRDKK